MTSVRKISLLAIAVTFLLLTPAAFADSMTLTGVGNNGSLYGVYVGPYVATVDGATNTPVICDDYAHESYLNTPWNVNVSSFPSLTNVRFTGPNETQNYDEVAYLANILFGVSGNNAEADALQYAMWDINDPTDVNAAIGSTSFFTDSSDPDGVAYWLSQANNAYLTNAIPAGDLSDLLIYTPTTGGSGSPQEFIVKTPEPSTILLLGLGLGALCFMKRRVRLASPIQA
jgi:hypothetical protein